MEKVLLYCGSSLKHDKAKEIIESLHMEAIMVNNEDLDQTLGYMIGKDGFEEQVKTANQPFKMNVMVFDKVSDERIVALTQAFQDAKCPYQGVKAVVTVHNQSWRLRDLFQEICNEHAYFQEYAVLQKHLQQVNEYVKEEYTQASWATFQEAMLKAYLTYQARPEQVYEISKAITLLKQGIVQLEKKL